MTWFTNLFPFIAPDVFMFGCGLLILWILLRWGDLIFAACALWHFWQQQPVEAVCYLLIALFFGAIKAGYTLGARDLRREPRVC